MKKPSILVVDDEPPVRDILAYFLQEAGYDVLATGDPDEALGLARDGRPDLAILDILMPRMDGFDLCQMIRGHPESADLPVIFLTALGDEINRERGRVCGAMLYLEKPFRKEAVLEAVRDALASRHRAPRHAHRGWGRAAHLEDLRPSPRPAAE